LNTVTKTFTENNIEYPEYIWYPAVLANATSSSSYLAHKLHEHLRSGSDSSPESVESLKSYINNELVIPGLGISDATDEELAKVAKYPIVALFLFSQMISTRAQIGWSSHGHSAVDVNIYSSGGPGTDAIRGNVENTDVGKFLREYIDVDVDDITKQLRKKMEREPKSAIELTTKMTRTEQDHWIARENLELKHLQEGFLESL
jgi:alkaline phosphatase